MTLKNAFGDLALDRPTASGAHLVGNARSKFRDGFTVGTSQPDPTLWYIQNDTPDTGNGEGHLITQGGNAWGSSYLKISLSPFADSTTVWLTSRAKFHMPMRLGWGVTISQRLAGQEVFFGVAEADDENPIGILRSVVQPADIPITGANAVVVSNVATITAAGHGLKSGDRVILVGCTDHRANVGPVQVTVADANTLTVPMTQANASYSTVNGSIRLADPLSRANNAFGLLADVTSATTANMASRRNGTKYRLKSSTIATTAAVQGTTGPYADALLASGINEQFLSMDECSYRSFVGDGTSGPSGLDKLHQSIPDEDPYYRLHVRARTLDDFSKPVAQIVSIAKTASTTATVVTDRPHGLAVADRVGIQGVRDQANFANVADAAVASVIDATTFTVAFGISATSTNTQGGAVFVNHGGVTSPGAYTFAVQSVARVNNVLTVTLNTTAANFIPGETLNLWGMTGGAEVYDGAYKILRQNAATVELESVGADFGSITTGGAMIKRTDVRLHFVRVLDHTRHFVEVLGGRAQTSDGNNAVPVSVAASATIPVQISNTPSGPVKTEDSAATSGDVGIPTLSVRGPATPVAATSAAGDYGNPQIDAEGKTVVLTGAIPDVTFTASATLSTTTAAAVRAAQAAGIRTFVTDVTLSNTSATATMVTLLDGAAVVLSVWLPGGATYQASFTTPIRGTAATALNGNLSVAATDVRVSVNGYSGV